MDLGRNKGKLLWRVSGKGEDKEKGQELAALWGLCKLGGDMVGTF